MRIRWRLDHEPNTRWHLAQLNQFRQQNPVKPARRTIINPSGRRSIFVICCDLRSAITPVEHDMPNYRFYAGRLAAEPLVFEFASDQEAINKAERLADVREVEVWEGARIVTALRPCEGKQTAVRNTRFLRRWPIWSTKAA
jgi:hypothetical protein